jgi:hypothetical protein
VTYPAALLVHTANLETGETTGTPDAWNIGAPTKTTTLISCRFGKAKSSYPRTDAGPQVDRKTSCIVPSGTAATVGKLITGNQSPFNRTYRITSVDPAMIVNSVSHLVLSLEVAGNG